MTELQIILGGYVGAIAGRFPRIKERWTAPLLRGPDWFFDVAVPQDFLEGPGRQILHSYRWRLFIPWLIEALLVTALWATGRFNLMNIAWVVVGITLFTRFNYYAARLAAEKKSRPFEPADVAAPVSNVVLSLEPRTLLNYTNWWLEGAIALGLAGAALWTAAVWNTAPDHDLIRLVASVLVLDLYMQAGILLVKRGVIGSSSAAPADNLEQYLAWRESLRRLATSICDLTRLMFACTPLFMLSFSAGKPVQVIANIGFAVFAIWLVTDELRRRSAHLNIASRTKPARLPLLPDVQKIRGWVCFSPSLPILLLRTANGYALNLASAPVGIAGLYFVGFAGLWMWLAR